MEEATTTEATTTEATTTEEATPEHEFPRIIGILLPPSPANVLLSIVRCELPAGCELSPGVSLKHIAIEDAIEDVDITGMQALLWVPPCPSTRLAALFDRLGDQLVWVHSLSAGVDYLSDFLASRMVPAIGRVTLTNGRGAFSSSLAE